MSYVIYLISIFSIWEFLFSTIRE